MTLSKDLYNVYHLLGVLHVEKVHVVEFCFSRPAGDFSQDPQEMSLMTLRSSPS